MGGPTRNEARRRYQQAVESLLQAIGERRARQLALAGRGVAPAGMSELEGELHRIRDELAAVIAAGSSAFAARGPISAAPAAPCRSRPQARPAAFLHAALNH
jgi:hypothetical protein